MTDLDNIILQNLDGTLIRVRLEALDGRLEDVTGVFKYAIKHPKIICENSLTYDLDSGFAIREFI